MATFFFAFIKAFFWLAVVFALLAAGFWLYQWLNRHATCPPRWNKGFIVIIVVLVFVFAIVAGLIAASTSHDEVKPVKKTYAPAREQLVFTTASVDTVVATPTGSVDVIFTPGVRGMKVDWNVIDGGSECFMVRIETGEHKMCPGQKFDDVGQLTVANFRTLGSKSRKILIRVYDPKNTKVPKEEPPTGRRSHDRGPFRIQTKDRRVIRGGLLK